MNQDDAEHIDIDYLNYCFNEYINNKFNFNKFEFLTQLNKEQLKEILKNNINYINKNTFKINNDFFILNKNLFNFCNIEKDYFKDTYFLYKTAEETSHFINYFKELFFYDFYKNDFIKYKNENLLNKIENKKEFKEIEKKRKI